MSDGLEVRVSRLERQFDNEQQIRMMNSTNFNIQATHAVSLAAPSIVKTELKLQTLEHVRKALADALPEALKKQPCYENLMTVLNENTIREVNQVIENTIRNNKSLVSDFNVSRIERLEEQVKKSDTVIDILLICVAVLASGFVWLFLVKT